MSIRESFSKTFDGIKKEYKKTEMTDRILDGLSIIGIILFVIALASINISNRINAANITFTVYPLAIAGISSAFRMKRRNIEETEANKLFNEWVIIIAGLTIISIITVIIAAILS